VCLLAWSRRSLAFPLLYHHLPRCRVASHHHQPLPPISSTCSQSYLTYLSCLPLTATPYSPACPTHRTVTRSLTCLSASARRSRAFAPRSVIAHRVLSSARAAHAHASLLFSARSAADVDTLNRSTRASPPNRVHAAPGVILSCRPPRPCACKCSMGRFPPACPCKRSFIRLEQRAHARVF
jgi:hypothetical protein